MKIRLTDQETGKTIECKPGKGTLVMTVISSKPSRLLDWKQYDVEIVNDEK